MAMNINEFAKFQYFLQIRKIVKFGSIQFDDYLFQDLTICYFPKSKSIFYSPKILLKYRDIDEKVVNFLQFYFCKNIAKWKKKSSIFCNFTFTKISRKLEKIDVFFFVVKKVSQKFLEIEKKTYFMNVAMSFLSP